MSICYQFTETGVVKTQKQLVSDIRRELIARPEDFPGLAGRLLSTDISKQAEIQGKLTTVNRVGKTLKGSHQGTYDFIESTHKLSSDPDAVEQLIVPVLDPDNYISAKVSEAEEDADIVEAELKEQVLDWQLESYIGTLYHGILQSLFETRGDTSSRKYAEALEQVRKHLNDSKTKEGKVLRDGRTLRDIVTEGNPGLTDDRIVEVMAAKALEVYNAISKKPEYRNAIFMPETYLYADDVKNAGDRYKGVRGIADLIVIKEDGTVDIIDFKVCTTPYSNWCAAKQYHTEYQLGIYRAMLAKHGIKGNVRLFVQPIFSNRSNAEDAKVEIMQQLGVRSTWGRSGLPRLHENGLFTSNINFWFGNTSASLPISSSVKVTDKAFEVFQEMIDYNPEEKSYSKQELIDQKLKSYRDSKGQLVWVFYDNHKRQTIKSTNKEFFTAEGGYFDSEYMKAVKQVKNSWVNDLYDIIEQYKTDGTLPSDYNFLNTKGSAGRIQEIMTNIFGEFVKPYYQPLDVPALLDNGILGFRNIHTNACYFIAVTNQSLSATYAEGKYGSILGNFISNDDVRRLNGVPTLLANVLNAESMKTLHILNMIAEEDHEFFKDKTIGNIRVINLSYSGENNSVPMDSLMANYRVLCDKTGTTNHFDSDIQLVNPWEEIGALLTSIEEQFETDVDLKKIVKSYKANTHSRMSKVNQLLKIRSMMEAKYPRFR